jgi:hypothetical protein
MIGGPPVVYQQGALPAGAIPFNPSAGMTLPVQNAPRQTIVRGQAPEMPRAVARLTPVKLPSPEALGVTMAAAPARLPSPEALGIVAAR